MSEPGLQVVVKFPKEVPLEAQGEALLAFEQMLRKLGMQVEHRETLDPMPPRQARSLPVIFGLYCINFLLTPYNLLRTSRETLHLSEKIPHYLNQNLEKLVLQSRGLGRTKKTSCRKTRGTKKMLPWHPSIYPSEALCEGGLFRVVGCFMRSPSLFDYSCGFPIWPEYSDLYGIL